MLERLHVDAEDSALFRTGESKVTKFGEFYGHRIVCAAIKHYSGTIFAGVRHCDQFMRAQMEAANLEDWHGEQGFLDNKYQFLDRYDAYKIAVAAGQITWKSPGPEGMLFSEDIY